jgi:xylulokinase
MGRLLGIDVSTTGVKALLVGPDGEVLRSATTPLTLSTPRPRWCEQDPLDWWRGALKSIQQVLPASGVPGDTVVAVGLTGQMHGLVLLGRGMEVLRPAILWNDQRTGPQCNQIRQLVGRERLIAVTGNDALAGFTAPKILWVRDHEPQVYDQVEHVLLPKDYIRLRLTGEYATDRAGAAGTLLLDLRARDWSREVLETLEIPRSWLPATHEGPEITGRISREAAGVTGLAAGTPVVGGAGDQAAQAVGVGAVKPGIVGLSLGTSGVVFASTDEPLVEPDGRLHAFCHAVSGRWHLMGVMLSAAGSLRWYRDTVAAGRDFEVLLEPAADILPGCDGLLFLPYLTGERTPYADPLARGAFVGLTVRHTDSHLARAVLEGVAFGLRDSFELIRDVGAGRTDQVRVSGGGARSRLWLQIIADVLGVELATVNVTEGAAYGAALLAGVGCGIWPDVDTACGAVVRRTGRVSPRPDSVARYAGIYPVYRELYPALKGVWRRLGDFA